MNNIPIFPIDPTVDQTLTVLLSPGHRARLSPLVESAQLFLLTGEWLDEHKRTESIQGILKKNSTLIDRLVESWDLTRKQFSIENYDTDSFLQMYALYYFSINVSKIQILLHELARSGGFGSEINLVDIGVGTGTTAIAVLDFLYSMGLACELHHQPFPVKDFHFLGVDRSPRALKISAHMVDAYKQAVQKREATLLSTGTELPVSDALISKILGWSKNVSWHEIDFECQNLPPDCKTNLVVLSNVFNEIRDRSGAVQNLEHYLAGLSVETTMIMVEPGDQANAKALMKWRGDFLSRVPDFLSIGPCGSHVLPEHLFSCSSCWVSRRESFHQHPLYFTFREACRKKYGDDRSFDDYINNQLSWSYVLLQKSDKVKSFNVQKDQLTLHPDTLIQADIRLKVLGSFYQKNNKYQLIDYQPDLDPNYHEIRDWSEFIKLCPLPFSGAKTVVFERPAGYEMPRLQFGQEILVNNLQVDLFEEKENQFKLIPQINNQTVIRSVNLPEKNIGGFLTSYDRQTEETINELAYRLFGFKGMREFQHRILERVLCGRSILGIAATGGGKSECFILPAMILPGITVVVSPLRALMTDQYDQRITQRYGLGDLSTYINGDVPFMERQARLKRMEMGFYKLVYFTPEQLERGYILDSLRRADQNVGVRYLAMDESHCISQWGHDFRPSYLNILHRLRDYSIHPVIIALTATASARVREDICTELGLNSLSIDQGGDVFVHSSNRPEIMFEVRLKRTTDEKIDDMLTELGQFITQNKDNQQPESALVFMPHTGGNPENKGQYFPATQNSEQGKKSAGVTGFASYLERKLEHKVAIYHGKMDNEIESPEVIQGFPSGDKREFGDLSGRTRNSEQTNFINSVKTNIDVMVATKGFGMGIDKPNIRLVIHRSPTGNLEAYAQEAGRAGRDGEMSKAILYYSPDGVFDDKEENLETNGKGYSQIVKSDHEIQSYFLNDRYIRREDVVTMWAFLRQVTHRLALTSENGLPNRSYLYFTCDEAIDFFDSCVFTPALIGLSEYAWPSFPDREIYGHESNEHKLILDRGYNYGQKQNYLNRILAAIYRIRPSIVGKLSQIFLESVQETGAKVNIGNQLNIDWKGIVHSNAYFGSILRQKEVTFQEFVGALEADSLLGFGQRINLSIKELSSLLSDIKYSEGKFVSGKWQGGILNFSNISTPLWGSAQGKDNLKDWREYAGASRRSHYSRKKANKDDHSKSTLDDYFTWKEVSKSRGWEVMPGPAFDDSFEEYLVTFMQMHDERKQSDWASYHRLLTDYVGVGENGRLANSLKSPECLRSVMLGYLESNEVVLDGKCFSCSNCVPDGRYDKYSDEQRKNSVVRMTPTMIEKFQSLKEYQNWVPNDQVIHEFFGQMSNEEVEGRSVYRYFVGWSGKLLDETVNHQTAKWLRMEGMALEVIPFKAHEMLTYGRQLIADLSKPQLLRLLTLLTSCESRFDNELAYLSVCAQINRNLQAYEAEVGFLERIISGKNQTSYDQSVYENITRLVDLYASSGPLDDSEKYQIYSLMAARNAKGYTDCFSWYEQISIKWDWPNVKNEIEVLNNLPSPDEKVAALVISWLGKYSSHRLSVVIKWIKDQPEIITSWPIDAQRIIISSLPNEIILMSPKFLETSLMSEEDEKKVVSRGLKYITIEDSSNPKIIQRLIRCISSSGQSAQSQFAKYIDKDDIQPVVGKLLPFLDPTNVNEMLFWHQEILNASKSGEQNLINLFRSFIPASVDHVQFSRVISVYQRRVLHYASSIDDIADLFIRYWLPFYIDKPYMIDSLFNDLDDLNSQGERIIDQILDVILTTGNFNVLKDLKYDPLPTRWENSLFLIYHLEKFSQKFIRANNISEVRSMDLNDLRDSFNWKKDPLQADMVVAIFLALHEKLPSTWITPHQKLVEILVQSGRSQMAYDLLNELPVFTVRSENIELSAREYINSFNLSQRKTSIPADYSRIAKIMLR
jgi:superfamily II DNA helicase RecQ